MTNTIPVTGEGSFLPSFCSIRMVFTVVITAELLAIVLVLGEGKTMAHFWQALSRVSLYVQWVALTGSGLLCLLHPWLKRLDNAWAGMLSWTILVLITGLTSKAVYYLLGGNGGGLAQDADGHLGLFWKSLGISGIVSALVLRYLYMQYIWRQQLKAEAEARLQVLQTRIRPHFLFNSMNTIASLTRTQPKLAGEVVQDLADLFRISLRDASQPSTLGEELQFVRRYLNIEKQRLGARLQVEWDLRGLPEQAMMPALILQPLVENGVYHGIEPSATPGKISISGRYAQHQVRLTIFNTMPLDPIPSEREGNRLAVENIRQRLAGVFLGEARLRQGKTADGYRVQLVFPHPWTEL